MRESRTQNFSQLITSSSGSNPRWASSGRAGSPSAGRGRDEQLAEGAGIDEAQLAALGEGDHRMGVGGLRLLGALGPLQLAAHAQVDDQGRAVVEAEQQVLAGPVDRLDGVALEPGAELLGARVATDRAPVAHLDRLDLPADDLALEVAPDGLDFGKLRHSPRLSRPPTIRRPTWAATCSASFLDRPSPVPRRWPATYTVARYRRA